MADLSRGDEDCVGSDVMIAQIIDKVLSAHAIQGLVCPRNWPAQRVVGPECSIQQFLDVMLWFIQVHRDFFFDHLTFFGDFTGSETGVQQHIHQDFKQLGEMLMCGSGMNTDRKSTRLNSSHSSISYAVFCLKKKKK